MEILHPKWPFKQHIWRNATVSFLASSSSGINKGTIVVCVTAIFILYN